MLIRIIALSGLFVPVAFAQDVTTVTLPTSDIAHVVVYLHNGGTRMEADALANQITAAAQADLAKQQAAAKAAQTPAPQSAEPK